MVELAQPSYRSRLRDPIALMTVSRAAGFLRTGSTGSEDWLMQNRRAIALPLVLAWPVLLRDHYGDWRRVARYGGLRRSPQQVSTHATCGPYFLLWLYAGGALRAWW